jgi:hypothetical protein
MDENQASFDGMASFARLWTDFASKMVGTGLSFPPQSATPEAARQMRSAWLKAWGEYCDQFMRSPEFQNTVRQSLGASIEMRKQMNEFLGRLHHEFQSVSRQDVDELMIEMRRLEQRIIDGQERLLERVERLSSRLRALEEGGSPGGHSDNGNPRRRKRRKRKESK